MASTYLNGVLISTADPNVSVGGSGAPDTIVSVGNLRTSTLDGAADNDTLAYGGGDASGNLYDGGSQDDALIFNSAGFIETNLNNVTVYGGTGSDAIGFGIGNQIGLPGQFPLTGGYVNITNSLIRGANNDPDRRPDGGDYIFFGEDTVVTRSLVNGNEGSDDINVYGLLRSSTVQGGKDSDYIYFSDSSGSRVNGNNENDVIVTFDSQINNGSSVLGGQDDDYIGFFFSTVTNSLVSGDRGADVISMSTNGLITTITNDLFVNDTFLNDFATFPLLGSGDYLMFAKDSTVLGGDDADRIEVYVDGFGMVGTLEPGPEAYPFLFDYHGQVDNTLIDGGIGNDSIFIGEDVRVSASTIAGGNGGDFIEIDTSFDWGGLWNSVVDGGEDDDIILIGEIGNSSAGITSIFGGGGNDIIDGDSGSYNVGAYWSGDAGDDIIETGDGKDTILGGSGNDVIDGEAGGDRITGGSGNDIFEYWSDSDSYVTGNSALLGSNIDTISDFNASDDRFRLDYTVDSVRLVSAGFSTDWQTTVNTALGSGNYGGGILDDNEAAIMTITSGNNAGTYLLYHDRRDADIWRADYDGIVLLSNATGTVTTSNFMTFFE